jgi:hypothetical protein
MSQFIATPTRIIGSCLAATVLGSLVVSIVTTAINSLSSNQAHSILAVAGSASQLFEIALLVGLPLVLVLGVPAFVLLAKRGWANYWAAAAVGLIPVAVLLAFGLQPVAYIVAPYSLSVALLAFFLTRRPHTAEHAP